VIDDPNNGGSPPGSWADALRYPNSIRILEDTRALTPTPLRAEPAGAADKVAPDFSEKP
jgi:hypothetical protein